MVAAAAAPGPAEVTAALVGDMAAVAVAATKLLSSPLNCELTIG